MSAPDVDAKLLFFFQLLACSAGERHSTLKVASSSSARVADGPDVRHAVRARRFARKGSTARIPDDPRDRQWWPAHRARLRAGRGEAAASRNRMRAREARRRGRHRSRRSSGLGRRFAARAGLEASAMALLLGRSRGPDHARAPRIRDSGLDDGTPRLLERRRIAGAAKDPLSGSESSRTARSRSPAKHCGNPSGDGIGGWAEDPRDRAGETPILEVRAIRSAPRRTRPATPRRGQCLNSVPRRALQPGCSPPHRENRRRSSSRASSA